ncbi:hypothetical protein R0J90_17000 [Micrococcus sp. SIMBA_144]
MHRASVAEATPPAHAESVAYERCSGIELARHEDLAQARTP